MCTKFLMCLKCLEQYLAYIMCYIIVWYDGDDDNDDDDDD